MKEKKRRIETLAFYNHTGIEAHLAKMARRGWMIERISNSFWTYRRIEPQELQFTVSYFPNASEYDPGPAERQQTLIELCAERGWRLACTWFQMQIFYHTEKEPVPINTDPALEVETIHRACRANYLRGYGLLFAVGLIGTLLFLSALISDTLRLLAAPGDLVTGLCCLALALLCGVELAVYGRWHKRAKKAAEFGIFLDTPSTAVFQTAVLALLGLGLAYWLVNLLLVGNPLMGLIALAVFGSIAATRLSTEAMAFVIAFALFCGVMTLGTALIPVVDAREDEGEYLRMEELAVTGYALDRARFSADESLFLHRQEVEQRLSADAPASASASAELTELHYERYRVKAAGIYDFCREQLMRQVIVAEWWRGEMVACDPLPWGADAAWVLVDGEGEARPVYVLGYPGVLVQIDFDRAPTAAMMALIGERLG